MREAGAFLAVNVVGALAGIACGGRLTDTIGARAVMLASRVSTGAALVVLGRLECGPAFVVALALLGCMSKSFRPAQATATAAHAAPEDRPRAFGLLRLALNLGWTVGPALGGLLASIDYELLCWSTASAASSPL